MDRLAAIQHPALLKAGQGRDNCLLHPRVAQEQVHQRPDDTGIAHAPQNRHGRDLNRLALLRQGLQQRINRAGTDVHKDFHDLGTDLPTQLLVFKRRHERPASVGPDPDQCFGGSQLQRALPPGQDADQGLYRALITHVPQPVDRLQDDLLAAIGQRRAQGLSSGRPADSAERHHGALAHILVGVLEGPRQRRHCGLIPQLAQGVSRIATHRHIIALKLAQITLQLVGLGGLRHRRSSRFKTRDVPNRPPATALGLLSIRLAMLGLTRQQAARHARLNAIPASDSPCGRVVP